jgi:catechol 2,3-dioxygenase-like lactoylglutathione lyase family enzyme
MKPIVDHIQVTVRDMAIAVPFYDQLLPLLGFNRHSRSSATIEKHDFVVLEYSHPLLSFAISSPREALKDEAVHRRRPGSVHHLAFKAESCAEVDRLYEEIKAIGALIVAPPREYPEYTPAGYYAFFFKDPDGIKYEIVTHDAAGQGDEARDRA